MPTKIKSEILRVRMTADMMAQARALAEKEDVPLSQVIRKFIKEKLDEEAQKPARRKTDKGKTA